MKELRSKKNSLGLKAFIGVFSALMLFQRKRRRASSLPWKWWKRWAFVKEAEAEQVRSLLWVALANEEVPK